MAFRFLALALFLIASVLGQEKISSADITATILVNERGESDLDVQTRMADAAEDTKFWAIVSGVGAIIVSSLALIFTFREARASRSQREQELRAYLHISLYPERQVSGIDNLVKFFFHGGDPSKGIPQATYYVVLENHGQTPAKNVECWRRISIAPYPNLGDVEFPRQAADESRDGVPSRSSLAPRGKSMLPTGLDTRLTQEEFDAVRQNKSALYLHGWVTYEDVFGKTWKTEFRYAHPIGDRFFWGKPPEICEAGNETT